MSHTEIYAFGPDGKPYKTSVDIRNAFRGAMAVWNTLEERYLPSCPRPPWARGEQEYYHRVIVSMTRNDTDKMNEVWGLVDDERLSRAEKIVLASTLDNVLVKREDILELLAAFREFDGDTNLPEQADGIEVLLEKYPEMTAIGFNQTSVNCSKWTCYEENEEETLPYNYLEHDDHWWLFDSLNEKISSEKPDWNKIIEKVENANVVLTLEIWNTSNSARLIIKKECGCSEIIAEGPEAISKKLAELE